MTAITDIIKILGGINGSGYSMSDLISDVVGGVVTVGGLLASAGFFTYVAAIMKSTFIKTAIVSSINNGLDIGNEFKDKFIEQGYTTINEANAQDAFKNVSSDKLLAFLWDNYSERTQVMNTKKHIDGGITTYFQNIGSTCTYNLASAVPMNAFRTMFEHQCAFKNNVYVPNIFFGAAFVAASIPVITIKDEENEFDSRVFKEEYEKIYKDAVEYTTPIVKALNGLPVYYRYHIKRAKRKKTSKKETNHYQSAQWVTCLLSLSYQQWTSVR